MTFTFEEAVFEINALPKARAPLANNFSWIGDNYCVFLKNLGLLSFLDQHMYFVTFVISIEVPRCGLGPTTYLSHATPTQPHPLSDAMPTAL